MKKLLLTMTALGLLTSCGMNTSSEADLSLDDFLVDQTDITEVDFDQVIQAFKNYNVEAIVKTGKHRVCYELHGKEAYEVFTYDENAKRYILDEAYAALGKEGLWSYCYDEENKPVLMDCLSGGHSDNVFVNMNVPCYESMTILGSDESASSWKEFNGVYYTEDVATLAAIIRLSNLDETIVDSYQDVMLTLSETTAQIEVTYTKIGDVETLYHFLVELNNIDCNVSNDIESMIADPVLPDFHAYTLEQKEAMGQCLGEELPFSDQFTACSSYHVEEIEHTWFNDLKYHENYIFTFEDYHSGNIIDDYAALLVDYTAGEKITDPDTLVVSQTFEKMLPAKKENIIGYQICLTYQPNDHLERSGSYGEEPLTELFPEGIFTLQARALVDQVALLNRIMRTLSIKAGAQLPQFDPSSFNPIKVDCNYLRKTYPKKFTIEGTFLTDLEATTALKAWIDDLEEFGYFSLGHAESSADVFENEGAIKMFESGSRVLDYFSIDIHLGSYDEVSQGYITGSGAFEIVIEYDRAIIE